MNIALPTRRLRPFTLLTLSAALFVLLGLAFFAFASPAQQENVLPVSKEPHHHLMFQNAYVLVYRVHATLGDSVLMHRHEYDMLSIQLGATETTVHYPDKPDLHQPIADGQLRYQLDGLVHSTEVMKADQPFNNLTIALLRPQTGKHNICAPVLAGAPLNCPPGDDTLTHGEIPEFATDQTAISVIKLGPHEQITLSHPGSPQLVVGLRDGEVDCRTGFDPKEATLVKVLRQAGDFAWLDAYSSSRVLVNHTDKEAQIVSLLMKP